MKEVILSHDSEAKIYIVPDEVADNLDKYCWDFAAEWVWHGPEKIDSDTSSARDNLAWYLALPTSLII